MASIRHAVGPGSPNEPTDLREIQQSLIRHRSWLGGAPPPSVSGRFDQVTARAIIGFQKHGAALANPNGVVAPDGFTASRLARDVIYEPRHRVFRQFCFAHLNDVLTEANYAAAATRLGCETAAIRAVADTEAKDQPWDLAGRPIILFERHKFSSHTDGRYNATHPDISAPNWGGYGRSAVQHDRLRRAAMLDEPAALKSASWGLFQILGENHVAAGFASVQQFVDAMMISRAAHLRAFANFVAANNRLRRAIQDKDWSTFARYYNGPGYRRNDYDGKMRRAYERFRSLVPAR